MEMDTTIYKSYEERVLESIQLLKQLLGTGIIREDPSYIQTKIVIDKWIADGLTVDENIEFPRYGRRLELHLPRRKDKAAEAVFKVIKGRR
jgi:hypothetical protein